MSTKKVAEKKLRITSGFREVFGTKWRKFGWSLQGGISKSLLYVFSARKNRGMKWSDSMTQKPARLFFQQ